MERTTEEGKDPGSEPEEEGSAADRGSGAGGEPGGGGDADGGGARGETGERSEPWDPWGTLSHLHETVGGIVDSALRSVSPGAGRFPRYDLVEVPGEGYRFWFDLPGLEKGAVEVSVAGRELTVAGERPRPAMPEGGRLERSERTYGRFRRTVDLPAGVDADRIGARMENGVLEVRLPLRTREAEAQRIEVE